MSDEQREGAVMSSLRSKSDKLLRWIFECPGCKCAHFIGDRWDFNGDMVKPTIKPSILVGSTPVHPRCHSFITDGMIRYLGDCEHDMAGQTVPLQPI